MVHFKSNNTYIHFITFRSQTYPISFSYIQYICNTIIYYSVAIQVICTTVHIQIHSKCQLVQIIATWISSKSTLFHSNDQLHYYNPSHMLIPHLSENLSLVLLSCSILKKLLILILNPFSLLLFKIWRFLLTTMNHSDFWDWFVQPPKVKSWIES
jgi:hypothetical protein